MFSITMTNNKANELVDFKKLGIDLSKFSDIKIEICDTTLKVNALLSKQIASTPITQSIYRKVLENFAKCFLDKIGVYNISDVVIDLGEVVG